MLGGCWSFRNCQLICNIITNHKYAIIVDKNLISVRYQVKFSASACRQWSPTSQCMSSWVPTVLVLEPMYCSCCYHYICVTCYSSVYGLIIQSKYCGKCIMPAPSAEIEWHERTCPILVCTAIFTWWYSLFVAAIARVMGFPWNMY